MLPDNNTIKYPISKPYAMGSNTYRMLIEDERIIGNITDNIEALKQAIYKIINTERYKHIIYSSDYGIELADLYGKPMPFVMPEIPRRISEALLVDDRITAVDNFELKKINSHDISVYFVVHSIYGALDVEKVVNV